MEMIGVPTGTVSPSAACSAVTTPANGEGSSTAALTVSTSAIVSLTCDGVADGHRPLQDVALGQALAEVGKLELLHRHAQYSRIVSTASSTRSRLGSHSCSSRLGG